MAGKETSKLKQLLDEQHDFPCSYTFKFIVPADKIEELEGLVGEGELSRRNSSSGKYISLTVNMKVDSSEQVMEVYKKVSIIEGLISL